MNLKDYFDFQDADYIVVKGTRVGIDIILGEYKEGASPEQIERNYRTLNLEQVYATITYYLHYRDEVEAYLERNRLACEKNYQEYLAKGPSELKHRLVASRAGDG